MNSVPSWCKSVTVTDPPETPAGARRWWRMQQLKGSRTMHGAPCVKKKKAEERARSIEMTITPTPRVESYPCRPPAVIVRRMPRDEHRTMPSDIERLESMARLHSITCDHAACTSPCFLRPPCRAINPWPPSQPPVHHRHLHSRRYFPRKPYLTPKNTIRRKKKLTHPKNNQPNISNR